MHLHFFSILWVLIHFYFSEGTMILLTFFHEQFSSERIFPIFHNSASTIISLLFCEENRKDSLNLGMEFIMSLVFDRICIYIVD